MDVEEYYPRFDEQDVRLSFTVEDYGEDEYSNKNLELLPPKLISKGPNVTSLIFNHNLLRSLPKEMVNFENLVKLDMSNNRINFIHEKICQLKNLKMFSCRNNQLNASSFPKNFTNLSTLEYLNISSNLLESIPSQFLKLKNLRRLYLGNNRITLVLPDIDQLSKLEVLYLGGNFLQTIPFQIGNLQRLTYLILADNQLSSLPNSLSLLHNLKCLSLHNNRLSTLPPEIINLDLLVISLRGNPLVLKFAENLTYDVPSLKELSARTIKVKGVRFTEDNLPQNLVRYLSSASHCVNPKCKGVYFSAKIEHIKFVDFCGLYKLPLLHYLCSPKCSEQPSVPYSSSESEGEDDNSVVRRRIKKVLLG